jgi:hypothetical protein
MDTARASADDRDLAIDIRSRGEKAGRDSSDK